MERSVKNSKDQDRAARAAAEQAPSSSPRHQVDEASQGAVPASSGPTGWIHNSPRMAAQHAFLSGLFGTTASGPGSASAAGRTVQRVISIEGKKATSLDAVITWLVVTVGGAEPQNSVAKAVRSFFEEAENRRTLENLFKSKFDAINLNASNVFEELLRPSFDIPDRQWFTDKTSSSKEKGRGRNQKQASNSTSTSKSKSKNNSTKSNRNNASSDDEDEARPSISLSKRSEPKASRGNRTTKSTRTNVLDAVDQPAGDSSSNIASSSRGDPLERIETKTELGPTRFPDWQEPQSTFQNIKLGPPEETPIATADVIPIQGAEVLVKTPSEDQTLEDRPEQKELDEEALKHEEVQQLALLLPSIISDCEKFLEQALVCDLESVQTFMHRGVELKKRASTLQKGLKTPTAINKLEHYRNELPAIREGLKSLNDEAQEAQGKLPQCVSLLYSIGLKKEEEFATACDRAVNLRELSGMKKVVGELLAIKIVEAAFPVGQGPKVEILRDIVALKIRPRTTVKGGGKKAVLAMESNPDFEGVPQSEFDGLVCQQGPGGLQIRHTVEAKGGPEDPTDQIVRKQRPFLQAIAQDRVNYCFAIQTQIATPETPLVEAKAKETGKEEIRPKTKKGAVAKQPVGKERREPESESVWHNMNDLFNMDELLIEDHKTITAGPADHFSIDFTQQLGVSYEEFLTILRFIARTNAK